MPALTLYFAPGASSMAPHIALHEVGATFDAMPISFKQGGTKTDAFRAINPVGQIPVLLIDGAALTEVAGILFYLACSFPAAGLLPDDPAGQARVVSWMSFIAASLHPARRQGLAHATRLYQLADARLGANDWCEGAYSIADIHLFRLFWRFRTSLAPDDDAFPNLLAHHTRMMSRDAVQRTIAAEAAIGYELPA